MGIKKYIQHKKKKKDILKNEEKCFIKIFIKDKELLNQFIEEIGKIEESGIPIEIEILSSKDWEKIKLKSNDQKTVNEELENDTSINLYMNDINDLKDFQSYQKFMNYEKIQRRKLMQTQFVSIAASFVFLFFLLASYPAEANPFRFIIQVVEYMDGKISVKSDVEFKEEVELEYDVYQVGYMTDDYVLMQEEELGDLYKMKYNKDPEHYIRIVQSSIYYGKKISSTDKTDYQIILLGDMEYFYNYNESNKVSSLYFTKGNTSIFIRGTIGKEEIFQIAKDIHKE